MTPTKPTPVEAVKILTEALDRIILECAWTNCDRLEIQRLATRALELAGVKNQPRR